MRALESDAPVIQAVVNRYDIRPVTENIAFKSFRPRFRILTTDGRDDDIDDGKWETLLQPEVSKCG